MIFGAIVSRRKWAWVVALIFCGVIGSLAQQNQMPVATDTDSTSIDRDGTLHIVRVVPVPKTVTPEAQKFLAKPIPPSIPDTAVSQSRQAGHEFQRTFEEQSRTIYPVKIERKTIAGVPAKIISPVTAPENKRGRALINLHGGGFVADWGSSAESVPIASLTQTTVIAVEYRLAPENPFPAAVDDVVAVYKEVLKTHEPKNIGLYGTSAGAMLSAEVIVRLKQLGLPLPAAVGFFSGTGDLSQPGDSESMFAVEGLQGKPLQLPDVLKLYVGTHDSRDPLLSPLYADLKGFPPTLCIAGTRDLLLSGTVIFHRALLHAGVEAQLVVFEAMPHAHWYEIQLPEGKEALQIMADFFNTKLGG